VKLFLFLVLHLRQFFIVRIFVKRATGPFLYEKDHDTYLGLVPLGIFKI
jgi:hypothetical protein